MNLKQMTCGDISYECKDDTIKCDKNKKIMKLRNKKIDVFLIKIEK